MGRLTIKKMARNKGMEDGCREAYENQELIEYRLSNIEKTLSKMETLLASNKLQDRDIEDLKRRSEKLEERVQKIENAPMKAKADRWNSVFDTVLKLVISAGVGVVLVKVGLK